MTKTTAAGASQDAPLSAEDIWRDDLFNRRAEADLLIGYLESVAARPTLGGSGRAYTLAVDAGYGEGKSFFLRRLAKHLEPTHPVAFVDAWTDDLADEPLIALLATMQEALAPLIKASPSSSARWNKVVQTAGRVAAIAAKGVALKVASLAIGAATVEALHGIATDPNLSKEIRKSVDDGIKDVGKDVVEAGRQTLADVTASTSIGQRMAEFKEGKNAIESVKRSLSELVLFLDETETQAPIFIIVDELDRCRPTYAIKLLEEIKHLFDVQGLVFIFGMHGRQLSEAVSAAYGPNFKGADYLKRFIDRHYTLAPVNLEPLINHLLQQAGISVKQLKFPYVSENRNVSQLGVARVLAIYMSAYSLSSRDAVRFVDVLQTCAAIAQGQSLFMAYLVPFVIKKALGIPQDEAINPAHKERLPQFSIPNRDNPMGHDIISSDRLFSEMDRIAKMTPRDFMKVAYDSPIGNFALDSGMHKAPGSIADPTRYKELLEAVGRFSLAHVEN